MFQKLQSAQTFRSQMKLRKRKPSKKKCRRYKMEKEHDEVLYDAQRQW